MKKISVLLILLSCFFKLVVSQGNKNFIDVPYIEVNGIAKMEIVPDEIFISIVINENDTKGKIPVEELENKMIKTLNKVGVDTKNDLMIVDFSSNFKKFWHKKPGVRNEKTYQIKVNSGKMAGMVFYAMEEIGVSNLSITKTDHSKIEEYKEQVKIQAMKAARKKATYLAEAIDQKAGGAIYIQEQDFPLYRQNEVANSFLMKSRGDFDKFEEIDFEHIKLEYRIFARFKLE